MAVMPVKFRMMTAVISTGVKFRKGRRTGEDCEGHAATNAEDIVEDHRHRLVKRIEKQLANITSAVRQDDGEKPATDICHAKRNRDGPRRLDRWVLDLFSDMRRGIVIGHCPSGGKEAEEEREAIRSPAGEVLNVGPDHTRRALEIAHDKQRDAAANEHAQVKNDVSAGHFFHCACGHRIQQAMKGADGRHNANSLTIRGCVAERSDRSRVIRVRWDVARVHAYCREQELSAAVICRRGASDLSQQVEPSA
ncbi:hypothetical protein MRB53_038657 [Persea americana]|nr:hypothetical protein MRB53_038657 [Persea americana]